MYIKATWQAAYDEAQKIYDLKFNMLSDGSTVAYCTSSANLILVLKVDRGIASATSEGWGKSGFSTDLYVPT